MQASFMYQLIERNKDKKKKKENRYFLDSNSVSDFCVLK